MPAQQIFQKHFVRTATLNLELRQKAVQQEDAYGVPLTFKEPRIVFMLTPLCMSATTFQTTLKRTATLNQDHPKLAALLKTAAGLPPAHRGLLGASSTSMHAP